MKRLNLYLGVLFALLLAVSLPWKTLAARPNPPTVAGSLSAVIFTTEPGGTNIVALPPRVLVIDERGRIVADEETTLAGLTANFSIPLKKAGTYVVVGYYPEPNRLTTFPEVADVLRKSTTTISLTWQPE